MTNNILVFDVGTTGARTTIYDMQGKEVFKSYEEYRIERQPPGISEQDPLIWWNAIKNTCNQVAKKTDPADIIGICATFQRSRS
jgi:xylulokinase